MEKKKKDLTREQSLCWAFFETSFVNTINAINPSLFTLASPRLFRQGQKAATFLTKIQPLGLTLNWKRRWMKKYC